MLKAWYEERKQQLETSLAITIENGKFVTESNPLRILIRDIYFWLVQLVPSWRQDLSLGHRKEGMVRYQYSSGFPFASEYNGGCCLSQVYCKAINGSKRGICFTDGIIFGPHKAGVFQLLIYLKSSSEIQSAQEIAADIDDMSNGEIHASETTILIEDQECDQYDVRVEIGQGQVYRLATGDEFARSPLCKGRPGPKFYDHQYLGKQLEGTRFVVLRPDRFVFARCDTRVDLRKVCGILLSYLQESG